MKNRISHYPWRYFFNLIRERRPNAVASLCFLLASAIFCASCGPVFYVPGPQQAASFYKDKKTLFSMGYARTPESRGFESYVVHSPVNRWSLKAGHTSYSGQTETLVSSFYGNGYLSEAGVGFYTPLDKEKKWFFETSVCSAFGNVAMRQSHTVMPSENYYLKSKFRRYSQMAAFTLMQKHFRVFISCKASYVNFYNSDKSRYAPEGLQKNIIDAPSFFLLEPNFTISAGHPRLQFYLSLESGLNTGSTDFMRSDKRLSAGICARW